ncbi:uncharacterized protein LOC130290535 isoform X2 [Hyla sarda]|uniref:uncharacterized protein LOC130290535 isoform X2 n=1 Tax=Hyla sarda TaxID=327740 RepID=UPI0024C3AF6A|nr:uncharacterized protein LOC130290535 isoform X2 [Hyla sarda]
MLQQSRIKELFCVTSEESRSETFEETLNPGHDSVQDFNKIKEQAVRELCIGKTKSFVESDMIDGTVCNRELLQKELHMDTVTSQIHDPCKKDLLQLRKHPVDQVECYTTNCSLNEQIKGNDCQKQTHLKDNNMSDSNILADKSSDLTLPVELIEDNTDTCTSIESQGSFDLCNSIHYQKCSEINPTNKHDKHLQTNEYDSKTSTPNIASDIGDLNTSTNRTVSESEKTVKMCSLDFQAKNTAIGSSRPDSTRNGKRKTVSQMAKCRKLGSLYETEIVSHKLEFVEEENLSEEESSEDDNLDSPVTYSRDRLDHRKERHQYVSDQLDPDVLHLLEMHLRKQQLVEIKEEREEELLDVHINKEKSRSETFKLLRNISPVLDMVLEEPELEHSGDTLEEGSKTPSDIESDDSSNSCAMELGLMESLQNDLMSKSSKIDKHEIATILQTPSSDISTRENKSSQKVAVCDNNDNKVNCETIKNKEPKTPREGTGDASNLHMDELQKLVDVNVTSGFNSGSPTLENGHDLEASLKGDKSESWKELNNVTHKDTETEQDSMEEVDHSNQCMSIRSGNKELYFDESHEGVSDSESCVTYTGIAHSESKDDAFTAAESVCVKTKDSKEQCPTLDGNLKPHDLIVPSLDGNMSLPMVPQSTDNYFPNQTDTFITKEVSIKQHDDIDKPIEGENIDQTDYKEELKAVNKENSSEPSLCSPAEMSTLRLDLEEKILSILEKAHAADCRSSHLQAGAELLWKESIELRNECQSLSKEAAELLSLFKKQSVVHRQPRRQSSMRTQAVGSLISTADRKPSNKETLNFSSKNDSRNTNKGEDQLKFLSKKYDFLREEAPEIMRELHVLQQDLKSLSSHHNKPMSILYSLLWGSLMTGGALLLAWWSTKHLG